MTLFREDVHGNAIPPTRPIAKPIEKFLDTHPVVDSKIERVRLRNRSRRNDPIIPQDLRDDLLIGLLDNRIKNRENLRKSIRRRNEEI
ncbi:MAG: hypothetical protein IIC67_07030 [Thaumarchaeota archaeon]|nr:hypothetical protein [Nitrososphaerota archaeon]